MNQIEYGKEFPKDVRQHKSTVFCKVFSEKKVLLNLYNALNDTNYQNEDDLEITTLENVIYITMKNNVSFIIDCKLNLYEQQSTFNPNMPLRGFLYFAQQYNKYVELHDLNLFSTSLKKIPTPMYIVFYNGKRDEPDRKILRLSDAFEDNARKGCLECEATMLNINYGHNHELMNKCQKLKEYAVFVDTARKYTLQNPKNPRKALSQAIDECITNNILTDLLMSQKAEVLEMVLTTFNKELYEKELREEAIAEGLEEGRAKGRAEGRVEGRAEGRAGGHANLLSSLVQKKLNKNYSVSEIAEMLEQSEDTILSIIEKIEKVQNE